MVADFGIAKAIGAAAGSQGATTAGMAIGTPAYMAPEQAAADPAADHRVDIYALGTLAYELIAGRPPFAGRRAHAVIVAHATEPPPLLSSHRPDVPPRLAALVERCMSKSPNDRPQTATEVSAGLRAFTASSGETDSDAPETAASVAAPVRAEEPRRPLLIAVAVLLALAILVAVLYA